MFVTLHQFLQEAENFLRNNPSETIIMSLKEKYPAMEEVTKLFFSFLKKVILIIICFILETQATLKYKKQEGKLYYSIEQTIVHYLVVKKL